MQPTPFRLSQAIWSAFRAAKPIHRSFSQQIRCQSKATGLQSQLHRAWYSPSQSSIRFYSDNKHSSDIEEKVQDAKDRIHDSLEARADAAANVQSPLNKNDEETIVHTLPESASIVYKREEPSKREPQRRDETPPDAKPSDLPSQIAALRSQAGERFSHFMDNLQSQIFVASRRINDLTGYTGIERLKREIEEQESLVHNTRNLVRTTRSNYSDAIANRSATQREVNDLLHRKHAWTPSDLERFTGLYRSDHANEQAEQKAHQDLSEAEQKYEEASTKLAKSILARYHEEQIWSDKIRQMSTWGTWGLMGLNILLFVVLQLAIEPWRRKRLVRGFEQKVADALALRESEEARAADKDADVTVAEATEKQPETVVAVASERLAEAVVDAITGSTDESKEQPSVVSTDEIETAAEQVTTQELAEEIDMPTAIQQGTDSTPKDGVLGLSMVSDSESSSEPTDTSSSTPLPPPNSTQSKPFAGTSAWAQLPASLYATLSKAYIRYSTLLLEQFNETDHVVLSRKELTTRVLEGVAAGAALAGGILFVLAKGR